jgi:uncharacterized protein
MTDAERSQWIESPDALQALFDAPGEASVRKEVPFLHPVYRRWIEASPFLVLATAGPGGLDASPRGDAAPLVAVADDRTLLLPERRGNNRIDSLRNIVTNPQVGLLFLVPGVDETLRVNGTARISVDPALLGRFAVNGSPPKCVIEVRVATVFFQCARALLRSRLWREVPAARPAGVPTAGEMLAALTDGAVGGARYDEELPARQQSTLY